jgi:hypothetical protein
MPLEQAAMRFDFKFRAPETAGKYQVLVHQIPTFRPYPLKSTGEFKQLFVPHNLDRRELVKAAAAYPGSFQHIATFTVVQEARIIDESRRFICVQMEKFQQGPRLLVGLLVNL